MNKFMFSLVALGCLSISTAYAQNINPKSELGQEYRRVFFNGCAEGMMAEGAPINKIRSFCGCAADYVISRLTVNDIMKDDVEKIFKLSEDAVPYCLRQMTK